MNHKPSQSCGPPTTEGASLDVPLHQSATLSDMCVNGPILCTNVWTQRWGARFISSQRDAPHAGAVLSPWWAGPGVRLREWTDESCVLGCVRDWECARLGENACRDEEKTTTTKDTKTTSEEKQKLQWGSQSFQEEILPLTGWSSKSLKEWTMDMRKSSSSPGFCFLIY